MKNLTSSIKRNFKLLLVEDNEGDLRLIKELLNEQSLISFNMDIARSLEEAESLLANRKFDIILLDLGLPDSLGLDSFTHLNNLYPGLAIVILTGLNDSEISLTAVNHGAQDYIVKGTSDSEKLVKSIVYSYERNRLKAELEEQLEARKMAEANARRLNRLLIVLSNINQAIVRINDKNKLIQEVCSNLLAAGEILQVILEFDNDPDLNTQFCLSKSNECSDNESNRYFKALHKKVIETRDKILNNNFRSTISEKHLLTKYTNRAKSYACIPLGAGEKIIGTIAIVSDMENFFDEEEIKLMVEIAEDLTFAFVNIDKDREKSFADNELMFNKKTAESLYNLSQKSSLPENELVQLSLKMAEEITNSKIGYLHFMNEDQESLDLGAWSIETLKNCSASDEKHYPLSSAGIWADSARLGEPVIHNDYPGHSAGRGMPEGHAVVTRHLSIPVIDNNKVVLIAGVGNKEEPYTESDSRHLMLLMSEMWKMIIRNRMIRELALSREKLKMIANRTSAVMYQLAMNGSGFEYVHEAIETLTGYNPQEINDIRFENLIRKIEKPGGEPVQFSLLQELWDGKKHGEYSLEYLIETKEGELKWLSDKSYPWLNDKGKILGSIGILMDISSQKEAEIEIVSQKIKREQLFSNSPIAIVQLDNEALILNSNSSFEKLFGYRKTEIIGKNLDLLIVPPELMDEAREFYIETMKGLAISEISIRKRKNDSIIYVSLAGVPIKVNGENVGFYAMYTDLTKQKLAEEALIKARDRAEESDKLKTAFLHNITHEIRTPMNAIVGFSSLLSDDTQPEEMKKYFIETIVKSSNHLLSIISDIVEISNIEANLVKVSRNEIDINLKMEEIFNVFNIQAVEKQHQLILKLPSKTIINKIISDETKLFQIISNLLNNAIKFTTKGKIAFGYSIENDSLEFFVSDSGIGIAQENQERIFERFYQVEYSDNRQFEGTGLGLSISKAYVEIMGGTIRVDSEPGMGSTFYFTIPVEKPEMFSVRPVKELQTEDFSIATRKKILVVEDIESNYQLIKYFLLSLNVEILWAENGKEAIDKFMVNKDIDLILMDIKMPLIDGYSSIKAIKKLNKVFQLLRRQPMLMTRKKPLTQALTDL